MIQTFADFGLIGLSISLALLVAWALASRRALLAPAALTREHDRGAQLGAERERAGMVALLATVVVFGISSLIDWNWFIPGVAVPAMMCAGWLAGRGPLSAPVGRAERWRTPPSSPAAAAAVVALVALALAAAWFVWQPLHSADADSAAIKALLAGDGALALADAQSAVASDPVSADALSDLSAVYAGVGDLQAARAQLVKATSIQPGNPATWIALAQFDLSHRRSEAAVPELRAALRLNPHSSQIEAMLAQAGGG